MSTTRAKNRPERIPMSQRNRLSYKNQDPNFVYRMIKDADEGERIKAAEAGGWEFVTESNAQVGDPRVADATQMGAKVSIHSGGGVRSYLMRIPKEFYEEDRKAKLKRVRDVEDVMKPNTAKGEYGPGLTND